MERSLVRFLLSIISVGSFQTFRFDFDGCALDVGDATVHSYYKVGETHTGTREYLLNVTVTVDFDSICKVPLGICVRIVNRLSVRIL